MSAPDAILSVHLNPLTCGVAKFNQQLAAHLGVPCERLSAMTAFRAPLLSLKASELTDDNWPGVGFLPPGGFDVLWHDAGIPEVSRLAAHVWYATQTGCPATVQGNWHRGEMNVLTFAMAHKIQVAPYEQLKGLLDRLPTSDRYTVSVSTGIHEGSPWNETFTENLTTMRGVFGEHVRMLGFLADDALAVELRTVQMAALFFTPAARANNTSLWSALEAGTPTITNLDAASPAELQHRVSVFDIAQLMNEDWPDAAACRIVRAGGRKAVAAYSWPRVLERLGLAQVGVNNA